MQITTIKAEAAKACRDLIAELQGHMARSGRTNPARWAYHYIGSRYSVADWITACQEALDENDFAHVTEMMERDDWDMSGLTEEVGTIDQRIPPVGAA